ncbi:MAG TPA: L-dopachrome tautomerase-related protein [Ohtaekwangia sp.]|uniref:SMP-30/gluconolactonase/LRE family protein n=1 Tax=Ohtaekwangia sp. TaxID=2066019 RepID=UPI002F9553D0
MKIVRFIFLRIAPALLGVILIGLMIVKVLYGTGEVYPDIGAENIASGGKLEKVITLPYPPGNLAVGQNGHVYFNYHPLTRPTRFSNATLFEWYNGQITPFPSLEFQKQFQGSFGLTIDKQNRLWIIEPATFDFKHTRIWAFDLTTKEVAYSYEFPEGVAQNAEEIRVTGDGKYVLLPNPGIFHFTASQLLVFSVDDHSVRTVIDGDPSVQPENWSLQTTDGKPYRLMYGLLDFAVGIDGIEISDDQQWLYIASMTSSHLYRVPLSDVLNKDFTPDQVAKKIETISMKPMSDGITIDKSGHVIITDVEHGGLVSFDPVTKELKTLARSKEILWADGVATAPDSSLYFTDSSIPSYVGEFALAPDPQLLLNNKPYYIYRLKH